MERPGVEPAKKDDHLMKQGFNCIDKKENKQDISKKVKAKNRKKDRLSAFDTLLIEKFIEGRQLAKLQGKPQLSLCREI